MWLGLLDRFGFTDMTVAFTLHVLIYYINILFLYRITCKNIHIKARDVNVLDPHLEKSNE